MLSHHLGPEMNADPTETVALRTLRLLVESVPGVVWAVDANRTTIFVSNGAEIQYGLPASHFVGHGTDRFREIIHPDDLHIFDASVAAHQDGPREHECRIIRSDGEIRWLYNQSYPAFGVDGTFEMVVGTSLDVTAQKRAERQFRNLVEELPLDDVPRTPNAGDPDALRQPSDRGAHRDTHPRSG